MSKYMYSTVANTNNRCEFNRRSMSQTKSIRPASIRPKAPSLSPTLRPKAAPGAKAASTKYIQEHKRRAAIMQVEDQVRLVQQEEVLRRRQRQVKAFGTTVLKPLVMNIHPIQEEAPLVTNPDVNFTPNFKLFDGSDVYFVKKNIILGHKEKRYIRIRWGDGMTGHEARWVGFAPSGWEMKHPLDKDPQLLGFFVKPKLCDSTTKTNKKSCNGWVTLSIDCERRAIKATIDGWTLGKVFIPTWLLGRLMHPVAVSERGTAVHIELDTEEGCEKVIRAGFEKLSTIENKALKTLKCPLVDRNFETEALGMALEVNLDNGGDVVSLRDSTELNYVSFQAVKMGLMKMEEEVIPIVINDQHAFKCAERGLWDLFYADELSPLDYLSERIAASIQKIFDAKQRRRRKEFQAVLGKLAHLRHILFYLANRDHGVVKDANERVQWFLMNSRDAGVHKEFTPDLCQLLVCLSVSDYEWEDVAVPFISEAIQRVIPEAMKKGEGKRWAGENCCELEDMFEALMSPKLLPTTLLQVFVLDKILKPSDTFRRHTQIPNGEFDMLERISAEELCCGISGLAKELNVLMYERSGRKDEIKKCILKREWQEEFNAEQWTAIEKVITDPMRLQGMLFRARMLARCHGTSGMATEAMTMAVDSAFELGKTADSFLAVLESVGLTLSAGLDERVMHNVIKEAVGACRRKQYITNDLVSYAEQSSAYGLLSVRQALCLRSERVDKLKRHGRSAPTFLPEVLPYFCMSAPNAGETVVLDPMVNSPSIGPVSVSMGAVNSPSVGPMSPPMGAVTCGTPDSPSLSKEPIKIPPIRTDSGRISPATTPGSINYFQNFPGSATSTPTFTGQPGTYPTQNAYPTTPGSYQAQPMTPGGYSSCPTPIALNMSTNGYPSSPPGCSPASSGYLTPEGGFIGTPGAAPPPLMYQFPFASYQNQGYVSTPGGPMMPMGQIVAANGQYYITTSIPGTPIPGTPVPGQQAYSNYGYQSPGANSGGRNLPVNV